MRRLFVFALLAFLASPVHGAEMLVVARDFTDDAQSAKTGDVLVVRPDGWQWGACECPPDFIVVQVPDITFEDAQQYEASLMDTTNPENPVVLKVRKYALDPAFVSDCIAGASVQPVQTGGKTMGKTLQPDAGTMSSVQVMDVDTFDATLITKDR